VGRAGNPCAAKKERESHLPLTFGYLRSGNTESLSNLNCIRRRIDADAASIRARKRTRRALCGTSIRSCERTEGRGSLSPMGPGMLHLIRKPLHRIPLSSPRFCYRVIEQEITLWGSKRDNRIAFLS